MHNIKYNLKTILTVYLALAIPTILSAATSFASVSPVETKSAVSNSETLDSNNKTTNSVQTYKETNLDRERLKALLKEKREVVLTFDDGPSPHTTPHILDILKKRHLRAAFFVLGVQANKYPDIIKRMYEEGHIIGNHTYAHKNLAKLKPAQIKKEIESTNNLIEKITGERPIFLRPPYGAINKSVVAAIKEEKMNMVLWTVDTRDWKSKNEKAILKEVDKQLHISDGKHIGGAILMHDIYPTTVTALNLVLDKLSVNDYKIYAIDNLGNTESDFWNTKSPTMCKSHLEKVPVDPEVCGNQIIISILKEKPKEKITKIGMIKARKEGNLMLYLAMTK